jgi:hypothetical protein
MRRPPWLRRQFYIQLFHSIKHLPELGSFEVVFRGRQHAVDVAELPIVFYFTLRHYLAGLINCPARLEGLKDVHAEGDNCPEAKQHEDGK